MKEQLPPKTERQQVIWLQDQIFLAVQQRSPVRAINGLLMQLEMLTRKKRKANATTQTM